MEYKLGINEARLLSMLCYKHNYFHEVKEFKNINGKPAFWITIPNIQAETNIKPYAISKAIKKLEKQKLIEVHKIGIPAKNHFIVNGEAINKFEKDHCEAYESWIAEINHKAQNDRDRFDALIETFPPKDYENEVENGAVSHIESQSRENSTTSDAKTQPLVSEYSTVTNNKQTNNKIIKINTNLTSEGEEDSFIDEELTELISSFIYDNDDQGMVHERVFLFLKSLVPGLSNFRESHIDSIMIDRISEYSLDPNVIALKILSNAKAIEQGKKSNRFGDLFVGLEEMNTNKELMFGT